MKHNMLVSLGVLCCIFFGLSSKVYGDERQKLELVISSQKDTYLLYEPIRIKLKFTNLSNKDIIINTKLAEYTASIRLYSSKDGIERNIWYQRHGSSDDLAIKPEGYKDPALRTIAPGKTMVIDSYRTVILFSESGEYAFIKAGEYKIKCEYLPNWIYWLDSDGDKKKFTKGITSNTISIEIDEPDVSEEELMMVKDKDIASFFQSGSGKGNKLDKFLQLYPDSPYAKYLKRLVPYDKNWKELGILDEWKAKKLISELSGSFYPWELSFDVIARRIWDDKSTPDELRKIYVRDWVALVQKEVPELPINVKENLDSLLLEVQR